MCLAILCSQSNSRLIVPFTLLKPPYSLSIITWFVPWTTIACHYWCCWISSAVKADAVASHLLQVARALVNKKHKCRVEVEWRYFLRHAPDKSLPPAFSVDKIYQAWVLEHKRGCHAFSPGSLLRTQSQKPGERRRKPNCDRETRKGSKTGGKLPRNISA